MRKLQWKRLRKHLTYIPAKNYFTEYILAVWQIQFEIMKRNSQRHPKDSYSKISWNSVSFSSVKLLRRESVSVN